MSFSIHTECELQKVFNFSESSLSVKLSYCFGYEEAPVSRVWVTAYWTEEFRLSSSQKIALQELPAGNGGASTPGKFFQVRK